MLSIVAKNARRTVAKFGSGQYIAYLALSAAIRKGDIPPVKGLYCEDCATPAYAYDHRDYEKPLLVSPVCSSCNRRRGVAMAKQWSFVEFLAWYRQYLVKRGASRVRFSGSELAALELAFISRAIKPYV